MRPACPGISSCPHPTACRRRPGNNRISNPYGVRFRRENPPSPRRRAAGPGRSAFLGRCACTSRRACPRPTAGHRIPVSRALLGNLLSSPPLSLVGIWRYCTLWRAFAASLVWGMTAHFKTVCAISSAQSPNIWEFAGYPPARALGPAMGDAGPPSVGAGGSRWRTGRPVRHARRRRSGQVLAASRRFVQHADHKLADQPSPMKAIPISIRNTPSRRSGRPPMDSPRPSLRNVR